jgi:hypothetical protein
MQAGHVQARIAIGWASTALLVLLHSGRHPQQAVNEVLVSVASEWGTECTRVVEGAIRAQFKPQAPVS